MKFNPYIQLAAMIARALAADPHRSNRGIADEIGISEKLVRRKRAEMELAGLLPVTDYRIGSDGVAQRHVPA